MVCCLARARRLRGIEQLPVLTYSRGPLGVRDGKVDRLNQKTYMTVTATLFLIMGIVHLLRIIFGWQAEIGGLKHSVLGELAGPFRDRWACIPRLHPEAVIRWVSI